MKISAPFWGSRRTPRGAHPTMANAFALIGGPTVPVRGEGGGGCLDRDIDGGGQEGVLGRPRGVRRGTQLLDLRFGEQLRRRSLTATTAYQSSDDKCGRNRFYEQGFHTEDRGS